MVGDDPFPKSTVKGPRIAENRSPVAVRLGPAGLTTYGNNVSDPDHKFGTAAYDHGFAKRALTFELVDADTLVMHLYSQFTDGSGRQNYQDREVFKRLRVIIDPLPVIKALPGR
jgi:hypothetical protein